MTTSSALGWSICQTRTASNVRRDESAAVGAEAGRAGHDEATRYERDPIPDEFNGSSHGLIDTPDIRVATECSRGEESLAVGAEGHALDRK
jgi:hypothetical protein